jgi:ATP-binding cassette, subfamily B, bacterial MsbA
VAASPSGAERLGTPLKAVWSIVALVEHHRLLVPILLAIGVMAAFAESLGLGLLMPFVAAVSGESSFGATQGTIFEKMTALGDVFGPEHRAVALGCFVIVFVGFKSALWIVYLGSVRWINERAIHQLRVHIFHRLCAVDYGTFTSRSASDYYNVLTGEMPRVSEGIYAFFLLIGRSAVAAVFCAILLSLSWRLFLASTAIFVVTTLAMGRVTRLAHHYGRRATKSNEGLSSRIMNALTGMRTIRAFEQAGFEKSKFADFSNRSRRELFRAGLIVATAGPILETIFITFFVVMLFYSQKSGIPLAQLVTFIVLMYRMVPHVRGVEEARAQLGGCSGSIEAVNDLMAAIERPSVSSGGQTPVFEQAIRFEHVDFGYDLHGLADTILRDVSFTIPQGATVAIVGASGSGKSTIINLLLGFYVPSGGRITIDGTPLESLSLSNWRKMTGFAGQDAQLFPGTIAENIAYGRPDTPRHVIEEVAARASVIEFTSRMPNGLDTVISRDGLDLSGGQRQRIALARALLVDPAVLILDEATNALDNATEAAIRKTLVDMSHSKTMLIVAHRLSTIQHADWIIALDKGSVSEQGAPKDLLQRNQAFARLYNLEVELGRG